MIKSENTEKHKELRQLFNKETGIYAIKDNESYMNWLENMVVKNCSIPVVVERLKKLQKWYPFAGCAYDTPSIDWEKDSDGDWISVEDIEQLIKELESNAL